MVENVENLGKPSPFTGKELVKELLMNFVKNFFDPK
jgi:hypothetical protein